MRTVQHDHHALDRRASLSRRTHQASILYDREAERVLSRNADDRVHDWLVIFARHWLLDAAGIRQLPADHAVGNAVDYLDRSAACWIEEAA